MIAIVRPRRSCLASPSHSSPASRRRTATCSARSATSVGKVVSRDSETAMRSDVIGLSSSKRARAIRYGPRRPPKRSASVSGGVAASCAIVCDPERLEPLGGLRPDPGQQPRREAREALARLLAREHDEALGLLGVGGDLRHQPVRADADRAAEPGVGLDLGDQAAHRGARRVDAREVEVGLVEAGDLDGVDLGAHAVHHALGHRAVGLEVGRQEDRLRAQPARARGRDGGEHAVAARLVGGGGDDRPRAGARDHDGPAPQLGAAHQLDAHVEGVHVQMRHTPLHAGQATPRPGPASGC